MIYEEFVFYILSKPINLETVDEYQMVGYFLSTRLLSEQELEDSITSVLENRGVDK